MAIDLHCFEPEITVGMQLVPFFYQGVRSLVGISRRWAMTGDYP